MGKFHAQKYSSLTNVELTGVADSKREFATKVAKDNNCRPFSDYKELFPIVDAVSIVVPTSLHHEVAKEAIKHNVHLLVEKPFTTTIEEADELIALAAEKDLIVQVGHIERFNPAIMALAPHISTPVFIEAKRVSGFKSRGIDVDVILDLMIHDIDLILSMFKAPVKTIHSVGASVITPHIDIANARIIFTNGCSANITASRISMDTERRMHIFQPDRYLDVDFLNKKIKSIHLKKGVLNNQPLPDISELPFQEHDALEMELKNFIDNINNNQTPAADGHAGRDALAVALQIKQEIERNQHRLSSFISKETEVPGL